MVANRDLQRINGHGWQRGFANMLRKENRQWWSGYRWLIHTLIWLVILNGLVVMTLFIIPSMMVASNNPDAGSFSPVEEAVNLFFQLGPLALAVGAIILAQDMLIAEKQSGVAEWLLSKPLARNAYFLSKLAASMLGVAVILVGLQLVVAYGLISLANGSLYPIQPYLVGVAGLILHTFFYLTLTLMMGVFANNRSVILGTAFGVLFAGMLLPNFINITPALMTPWLFSKLLGPYVYGMTLPVALWVPFAATSFWIVIFTGLALWKFNRLDF